MRRPSLSAWCAAGIAAGAVACAVPVAFAGPTPALQSTSVVPPLTATDRQIADRLMRRPASEQRSAAAAAGLPPSPIAGVPASDLTLLKEGTWHIAGKKLGIARVYRLKQPITLTKSSWPVARFPEDANDYQSIRPAYAVKGLRSFTIFVDTRSGQVVGVEPKEFDAVTEVDLTGIDGSVDEAGEAGGGS